MAKTVIALLNLASQKLAAAEALAQMNFYSDAVSRAYYAMFHAAQALLVSINKPAQGHAGTISAFTHHFVKTNLLPAKLTEYFAHLKESREFADYESLRRFTQDDATTAIEEAKGFLSQVNQYLKNQTSSNPTQEN